MVNRVQEEPFMVGAVRQIRGSKKGASYGKAGGGIFVSARTEKMAEAQQTLCSNGACGRVDRLIRICRLCIPPLPIPQFGQSWRASVPVADSVARGGLPDVEVAGGLRSLQQQLDR